MKLWIAGTGKTKWDTFQRLVHLIFPPSNRLFFCYSWLFWSHTVKLSALSLKSGCVSNWVNSSSFNKIVELSAATNTALPHEEAFLTSRLSRLVVGVVLNFLMWPTPLAFVLMARAQEHCRVFTASPVNWLKPQGCPGIGRNDLCSSEKQHIECSHKLVTNSSATLMWKNREHDVLGLWGDTQTSL